MVPAKREAAKEDTRFRGIAPSRETGLLRCNRAKCAFGDDGLRFERQSSGMLVTPARLIPAPPCITT